MAELRARRMRNEMLIARCGHGAIFHISKLLDVERSHQSASPEIKSEEDIE